MQPSSGSVLAGFLQSNEQLLFDFEAFHNIQQGNQLRLSQVVFEEPEIVCSEFSFSFKILEPDERFVSFQNLSRKTFTKYVFELRSVLAGQVISDTDKKLIKATPQSFNSKLILHFQHIFSHRLGREGRRRSRGEYSGHVIAPLKLNTEMQLFIYPPTHVASQLAVKHHLTMSTTKFGKRCSQGIDSTVRFDTMHSV